MSVFTYEEVAKSLINDKRRGLDARSNDLNDLIERATEEQKQTALLVFIARTLKEIKDNTGIVRMLAERKEIGEPAELTDLELAAYETWMRRRNKLGPLPFNEEYHLLEIKMDEIWDRVSPKSRVKLTGIYDRVNKEN